MSIDEKKSNSLKRVLGLLLLYLSVGLVALQSLSHIAG